MSWIIDHLNLVIVGALVLGSFLKSRFDSVKEEKPESDPFPDYGGGNFPEQSERRTPPAMPYVPPPIDREKAPVRRKSSPSPQMTTSSPTGAVHAAAAESAKVLKHQQELVARLRVVRENKAAATSRGTSTPRRRAISGKPVSQATITAPRSISASLRDPSEIRRAFVMREILDMPVGLR